MPIRRKTLVEPYDGLQRYLVNLVLDHTYLVDLAEHSGNGACGCEDFQFRCAPALRLGAKDETTRCKHIKAAIYFLGDQVNKRLTHQQRVQTWKRQRGLETPNPMEGDSEGYRPYQRGGAKGLPSTGSG